MNEDSERIYEVGFLMPPSIPEDSLKEEVLKIKELITEAGGRIILEGTPGLETLAYTIEKRAENLVMKFDEAYFSFIKFELDAEKVSALKINLDKNPNIIRYILVTITKEKEREAPRSRAPVREETTSVEEVSTPAVFSEEEIDKSIEELIAE